MCRTAPEESNLATNAHPQDTTKVESVRTYMSVTFPGLALIRRYEQEHAKMLEASAWKVLKDVRKTGDSNENGFSALLICMVTEASIL
eukprot:5205223-Karenia_brevis.AAC.1